MPQALNIRSVFELGDAALLVGGFIIVIIGCRCCVYVTQSSVALMVVDDFKTIGRDS